MPGARTNSNPPRFLLTAAAAVIAGLCLLGTSREAAAVNVPAGFVEENAFPGTGLFLFPVQVVFMPGNRKLVVEKDGRVWMMSATGVKQTTPFLDIRNKVLSTGDRGLLGVAVDPDYLLNRWIYFLFVVDPDSNGVDAEYESYARLERYKTSPADSNVIDLTSRQVLIGKDWPSGIPDPCRDLTHTIGTLRFGRDKTLLVGSGDAAHYDGVDRGGLDPLAFGPGRTDPSQDLGAYRAQSLNSLNGKILRIDKETGLGIPSNPYWDGNPASARSRVWVYGLRNPFRFCLRPGSGSTNPSDGQPGTLFVADVGWGTWEELNILRSGGANLGWPCVEGPVNNTAYTGQPVPGGLSCVAFTSPQDPTAPTPPTMYWNHNLPGSSNPTGNVARAIVAGTFYTGTSYPAAYRNRLFIADFSTAWIRAVQLDDNDNFIALQDFVNNGAGSPGDIEADPVSGDLFYISVYSGLVHRIRYVVGNRDPVANATLSPLYGLSPLTVNGSAVGSFDPDNDDLKFLWRWGDGDSSITEVASHVYTTDGVFSVELDVSDANGGLDRRVFTVVSGQIPPPGQILIPRRTDLFAEADTVHLQAVLVDTTGGPVSYRWDIDLGHLEHFHLSQLVLFGPSVHYFYPELEDVEPHWNRIRLTVVQGNITQQDTVEIYPNRNAKVSSFRSSLVAPRSDRSFVVSGVVQSTGAHGTHQFRWRVKDGNTLLTDQFFQAIIPAGDSTVFNATIGPLSAGPHVLHFLVDPDTAMVESDETDNEAVLALNVGGPLDAFAEWRADSANGSAPYPTGTATGPWRDLISHYDGTVVSSGGAFGWQGNGTPASPRRLELDGIDDRVTLVAAAGAAEYTAPAVASAELWFRTGSDVVRAQTLLEWVSDYGPTWSGMSIGIANGKLRVYASPWHDCAPLTPEAWHCAMFSKGTDSLRVWLDGRRVAADPFPNLGAQNSELVLGAATRGGAGQYSESFGGGIAMVRLYDNAQTDGSARASFLRDSAKYIPAPPAAPIRVLAFAADSANGSAPPTVPGAASPWADLSAGHHHAALQGFAAVSDSSGWQGDGSATSPWRLELDGLDDRAVVTAGSVPALQAPAAVSAALWFRTGADVQRAQTLIEWRAASSPASPGLAVGLANGRVTVGGDAVGPQLLRDTWHHAVLSEDAHVRMVVIDGRVVLYDFGSHLGEQQIELALGASPTGTGGTSAHFRGALARAQVWQGALDSLAAIALYEAESAPYVHRVEAAVEHACISSVVPCITIPIQFTSALPAEMLGYSVTLRLSPELALCGDGIESAGFFDAIGSTFYNVQDRGGGEYIVDEALLGDCGTAGTGPLFRLNVAGTMPNGVGTITLTSVRVRDCDNHIIAAEPGDPIPVLIDRTPPAAPTAMLSAPVTLGGDVAERRRLRVTFNAPADAESVRVYRAAFGNYPEYDDAPGSGSTPAAPGYPPGPPWSFAPIGYSGRIDLPPVRDEWYYAAFAWDSSGNRSPVSGVSPGSIDYLLGDVTGGTGVGDARVDKPDLDSLIVRYGASLVTSDPRARLDVGPTRDTSPSTRPVTDNKLDFEDLMMLAVDWTGVPLSGPPPSGTDVLALDFSSNPAAGDTFRVGLQYQGSGRVHGISLVLGYNATRVVPVRNYEGPYLATQSLPSVSASSQPANFDAALLGSGPGFTGNGILGTMTFRRIATGSDGISIVTLKGRDGANQPVTIETGLPILAVRDGPVGEIALSRAEPEPSMGSTSFTLSLPADMHVRMQVFDLQGRIVRRLRDTYLDSGTHRIQWDGRDDAARHLSAGIYLVRMEAGSRSLVRRVTLLR